MDIDTVLTGLILFGSGAVIVLVLLMILGFLGTFWNF